MARKIPVASWTLKHNPSKDPKFHSLLMFLGQGRVISLVLAAAKRGCDFITLMEDISL